MHVIRVLVASALSLGPLAALPQTSVQPPQRTFYVSPLGNDLATGLTPLTPWRTIARVNQQVLAAGDTVCFKGGAVFPGNLVLDASESGTPTEPITFTAYGVGPAGIAAGTGNGFDLYNVAGIRIANLSVIGSGIATSMGIGISFYADLPGDVKLPFVRIEDCRVTGFRRGGISIGAYSGRTGFEDVRVERCLLDQNGNNGMAVWGFYDTTGGQTPDDYAHHSIYVGHNVIQSNHGDPSVTTKHTGSGVEIAQAYDVLVEYNRALENGRDNSWTGGGPVGLWMWDVLEGVIQFNESYRNKSGTLDGGGFDLDGGCVRCVLQYNYSHDNDGPGFMIAQFPGSRPMRRCSVRYNISERDGGRSNAGALQLWSGDPLGVAPEALVFHNNTVYVEPKALGTAKAFRAFGSGRLGDCGFANNVFLTGGSGAWLGELALSTPPAFAGNLYYAPLGPFVVRDGGVNFASLAAWRAARGQELVQGVPSGFEMDPLLTAPGMGGTLGDATQLQTLDAYRLLPTSPLNDLGLFLPTFGVVLPELDFYGNPVPAGLGLSIGADEGT